MRNLATVELDSNEAAIRLTSVLSQAGFQVIRSFDLQNARAGLRAPQECPCPHHGTADCTCQYLVLLVSAPGSAPATLVIHGHDNQTLISLDQQPNQGAAPGLEQAIRLTVSSLATAR